MTVLIAYGTIEGQTGKIARFVDQVVQDSGEDTVLFDTSERQDDVSLADVDNVILAGSVHERRHPEDFEVFLLSKRKELDTKRTLLLSVSLSAAFPEGLQEAQDYADEMKMRTELDPDKEALIAGAIRTRRYGYFETQVLKHVVLRGRNFDPAVQEHEFTDWDALTATVQTFVETAG